MPSTNGTGGAEQRSPVPLPPAQQGPSLGDAFIRLFEAGQRVVLDRVDLARFDLAQIANRTLRAAALVAVGAVWMAGAWFALLAGGVVWALNYMPLAAALALAGVLSLVIGGIAIAVGLRRAGDPASLAVPSALREASNEFGTAASAKNGSGAGATQ